MTPTLKDAVRLFVQKEHLKSLYDGAWTALYDEGGNQLAGIRGRMGAASTSLSGQRIGVDLIEMKKGAAFPLHYHEGDHILYILAGPGVVHIDGIDHHVTSGDSVFIAAELPHGVRTYPNADLHFLAFGVPHKHLSALDRMKVIHGAT
jgi:quercetin dioxygenase-like cupin family protein